MWKNESDETKRYYAELAREADLEHKEMFPDYKYTAGRSSEATDGIPPQPDIISLAVQNVLEATRPPAHVLQSWHAFETRGLDNDDVGSHSDSEVSDSRSCPDTEVHSAVAEEPEMTLEDIRWLLSEDEPMWAYGGV
jgi:hypothetical protein